MKIQFHKEEFSLIEGDQASHIHIFDIVAISFSRYAIPESIPTGILEITHESGNLIEIPDNAEGFSDLLDMLQNTFDGFKMDSMSNVTPNSGVTLWNRDPPN